jgi:hypothetical protein
MRTSSGRRTSSGTSASRRGADLAVFTAFSTSKKSLSLSQSVLNEQQIPHRRHHDFCNASHWTSWFSRHWTVKPPSFLSVEVVSTDRASE